MSWKYPTIALLMLLFPAVSNILLQTGQKSGGMVCYIKQPAVKNISINSLLKNPKLLLGFTLCIIEGAGWEVDKGVLNSPHFHIAFLQIIKNEDLEELKELGSGTFGTVYHGKWRGTDVAIKRIKKSCFTGQSSELERLVTFLNTTDPSGFPPLSLHSFA